MSDAASVTVLDAGFVTEARNPREMPPGGPPEVAIAGRSNVGKSTLLNRMAGRRGLARVSKRPGRTRGLVVFELSLRVAARPDALRVRLVDLPGYGYAKVSLEERRAWQTMVEGYLRGRSELALVLILVDARRGLAEEETQLMAWLEGIQVSCYLVVTKSDKLGASERGLLRQRMRGAAAAMAASVFLASGETGEGVDRLWSSIAHAVESRKGDGTTAPG
jgi:GTP-binding protein